MCWPEVVAGFSAWHWIAMSCMFACFALCAVLMIRIEFEAYHDRKEELKTSQEKADATREIQVEQEPG